MPLCHTDTKIEFTDEGNELLYCGKIYDILERNSTEDTLFVTAVYDNKENSLNEALTDISVAKKDLQSGALNLSLNQSSLLLFKDNENDNIYFYPVFICFIKDKPEIIKSVFLKCNTPPPRYHIFQNLIS
ncbi:MAG: hypothetical protein JSS91_14045 [Bacteroidetes bacterium]|nr:hypothetical protein [Bacteroidota bacterium]